MSFVFWDTETTGIDTKFDQILQFAAILTDDELVEQERFEIRCRLDRHVVPSAMALQVTGQTVADITNPDRLTHYQMMTAIREKLEEWTPATFVGWNTIGFDEPLLQQAFYKSLHPPYLTVMDGNGRSDAMKLTQCLEALAPDIITIPTGENGRPIYKLDQLAPANGFPHLNAHDALADVEATIFIAQLIRERSPETWQHLCHCGSKQRVLADLRENPACLYRDSFFGRPYESVICRFATDDTGAELCFDLRIDPGGLAHLEIDHLRRALSRSPKPVRRIRPNKSPLIMPLPDGQDFGDVAHATLIERAMMLLEDGELQQRLEEGSQPEPFPPGNEVEEKIFDGFPSNAEKAKMEEFHAADWPRRAEIVGEFEDDRYRQIACRILLGHDPALLPDDVRTAEMTAEARRLTGRDIEEPGWLTLHAALDEGLAMLENCEPAQAEMLEQFRAYIEQRIEEANAILG